MAITTQKKINPYLRASTTIVSILDGVGTLQAAVPGLTAETLATFTGNVSDAQFNNSTEVNESTKIASSGIAAVAVNQYDASVDVAMYDTFTIQQLLNIPETSSSSTYIAYVTALERTGYADNISANDARTLFILCVVATTVAKYWQDQKTLGAGSSWNNYLSALTYSSGWTLASLKGALLYCQNGASIEAIIESACVFTMAQVSSVTK